MNDGKLRTSQVVTTFGPGAMVDLPDVSIIVGGLDDWKYDAKSEFPIVQELRLVEKIRRELGMDQLTLRKPPPAKDIGQHGFHPAITGWRFPEWFISQKAETGSKPQHRKRRLIHWNNLDKGKYRDPDDGKKYKVVPVRFVRACKKGHVDDIDWPAFVHGQEEPCGRELWIEERGTTGDLEEVFVVCACGKSRPVAQAARLELKALGMCQGRRPWLGAGSREKCGEPSRLLIRSASNAYFPQLISVISIPDLENPIDEVVASAWDIGLSIVDSKDKIALVRGIPAIADKLQGISDDDAWASIEKKRQGRANEIKPVKEAEFEVFSGAALEESTDEPEGDFFARALAKENWEAPWMEAVEKIVLVHRLREVVAQVGFTRFEAAGTDIQGELDMDVKRAPLAKDSDWLPAIENRGEGIFIQFNAETVDEWLSNSKVVARSVELLKGFEKWRDNHEGTKRQFSGTAYVMLHSFSHLLLNAISLECGYPASSLRERVYSIPGDDDNPAGYGILIYTGSADAEGTLGGLILTAREIRRHFRRALQMATLCSNDPVCANHRPSTSEAQPLAGAACHGCLSVAETSCEQRNEFLDRALVVRTVEHAEAEFFKNL